jgi:hypothetical protein
MHPRARTGLLLAWLLSTLIWGADCSNKAASTPQPVAVPLGVQVTGRGAPGIDPAWVEAYEQVQEGAFAFAQFPIEWGEVESAGGTLDWTPVDPHRAQAIYQRVAVSVEVLLVDRQIRGRLPADLDGDRFSTWDDPRLEQRLVRFLRMLEVHLRQARLLYLWLGRDVDGYLARHREELPAYARLLSSCRDSLAADGLSVRVGAILSYGDALDAGALGIGDTLAVPGGPLGLTVYGCNREFTQVVDPAGTMQRIAAALARFPGTKIVLCEIGYPAAETDGPQQEFATRLTALLSDPPANLEAACWFCLNDWHVDKGRAEAARLFPEDPARQAAYVGHLGSIGLRHLNGVPKAAWWHLQGWNRSRAEG